MTKDETAPHGGGVGSAPAPAGSGNGRQRTGPGQKLMRAVEWTGSVKTTRNLLEGLAFLIVGLGLWLFADGVETPVITLTKVGLVLAVVGAATLAAGVWQVVSARKAAARSSHADHG